MAKPIPIGTRAEAEEVVEFKHTLTAHHASLPPIYSTPDMIRLMERATFLVLQPFAEGDEISVGTSINIEHRAASGIGAVLSRITAACACPSDAIMMGAGVVGDASEHPPHIRKQKFSARKPSRPLHFHRIRRIESLARIACVPKQRGDPVRRVNVNDAQALPALYATRPIPTRRNRFFPFDSIGGQNLRAGRLDRR